MAQEIYNYPENVTALILNVYVFVFWSSNDSVTKGTKLVIDVIVVLERGCNTFFIFLV